jgi:hypothetical protein
VSAISLRKSPKSTRVVAVYGSEARRIGFLVDTKDQSAALMERPGARSRNIPSTRVLARRPAREIEQPSPASPRKAQALSSWRPHYS